MCHAAMKQLMRGAEPQVPQLQKQKKNKKEKNPHIPMTIQNMDDVRIGGQLIVLIISSSIEKIVDESNSEIRPTSGDHQAKTRTSAHNQGRSVTRQ